MKKNIGAAEKLIRVLVAFGLAMLYYFNIISGNTATVVLSIAVVLLLTALFNFCPLKLVFNKKKKQSRN